ncbi:MAG: elongation factor Ts [Cyanobacteriota bacterium]|nr:elongation factor Ts [Cyanobacteriota bacterium]
MHITAQQVKQLRNLTGARIMECKRALIESQGEIDGAIARLRQKDLTRTEKLDKNELKEGFIESYVHLDKRIGVLLEINCQTDFVARCQPLRELAKNLVLQIAAFPVQYLSVEGIPPEVVEQQRGIERGRLDLAQKPESLRQQIVEGRLAKRLQELTLLEQSYLHDPKIAVKEVLARTSAAVGEKIQLKRFARFDLSQ